MSVHDRHVDANSLEQSPDLNSFYPRPQRVF